tara:strand:- start:2045 stop:2734 length:690 start_codon:yes stop_codon:yes gene_type:complete
MTMITAGTGGFSGSADAKGPNAGYDPVMKFRSKLKKSKEDKKLVMPGNKLSEADMTGAPSIKDAKPAKSTPVKNYPGLGIAPTIAGLKKASSGGKIKVKESVESPNQPSRLFQYKVTIPEVGETIIYASSIGELTQKMRLLVNPKYRGNINIERILPGKAAEFFQNKKLKHMRNIKEDETKDAQALADEKVKEERKKAMLKQQQIKKRLQIKTQQIKKASVQGVTSEET